MDFLYLTFPILLAVLIPLYFFMNRILWQNFTLLSISIVFYGWVHPWFCILIFASTITDYFCGLKIRNSPNKKAFLATSIFVNLGILFVFKYFNFFADNFYDIFSLLGMKPSKITLELILPVGISFYTFQTLSYTIDIYRGKIEPEKNFITFSTFVTMFPQLVAGPIERASHLLPQLRTKRSLSWANAEKALPLICTGYFKKVVIADSLAPYVERIFSQGSPSYTLLLTGAILFSIQILCDFSGYTDIARGLSHFLGIDLMKNFHFPYLATTPSDFWRRWHISLSTWFRDYVYIPLGGSHGGKARYYYAVTATMLLSGLWHGASWNFVFWGLFHAIILLAYVQLGFSHNWKPKNRASKLTAIAMMYSLTLFGWLIFRSDFTWLMKGLSSFTLFNQIHELITLPYLVLYSLYLSAPLLAYYYFEKRFPKATFLQGSISAFLLIVSFGYFSPIKPSFIYFQF